MNEKLKFTDINTIPCLTWNWLKMNRATVEAEASQAAITEKKEIISKAGSVEKAVLTLDFKNDCNCIHEQVITAGENSELTVIMLYASDAEASGFSRVKTVLKAKENSKIHLVKVQLLGSGFVQIDDTAGECDDNAQITFTQIELGGKAVYAQLRNDLRGNASKFKSDTAYICRDEQILDMNYVVNHFGPRTDTKMLVKGTLGGSSLKTYRGTIDFKNGCAEATGDEQEETLLLSPTAVNKSIPMILCDEENVSGTHGATLGRLGADELFYFQSRGISEEEAERTLSRAKVMAAAGLIPDENTVSRIKEYIGGE